MIPEMIRKRWQTTNQEKNSKRHWQMAVGRISVCQTAKDRRCTIMRWRWMIALSCVCQEAWIRSGIQHLWSYRIWLRSGSWWGVLHGLWQGIRWKGWLHRLTIWIWKNHWKMMYMKSCIRCLKELTGRIKKKQQLNRWGENSLQMFPMS